MMSTSIQPNAPILRLALQDIATLGQHCGAWGGQWWQTALPVLDDWIQTRRGGWRTHPTATTILRQCSRALLTHVTGLASGWHRRPLPPALLTPLLPSVWHGSIVQAVLLARQPFLPVLWRDLQHGAVPMTHAEVLATEYVCHAAVAFMQPLLRRLQARERTRRRLTPAAPVTLMQRRIDDSSWQTWWPVLMQTALQHAMAWSALQALMAYHETNLVRDRQGRLHPHPAPRVPALQVFRVPQATACPHCQRLYTQEQGAPRLYALTAVLTGKSVPIGVTHLGCQCGPWYVAAESPATPVGLGRWQAAWRRAGRTTLDGAPSTQTPPRAAGHAPARSNGVQNAEQTA